MMRIALFLLCLALSFPAQADDYAAPKLENIVRTLVRFGALDLTDTTLMDEYAMVTDCDLYKRFYVNDFQWNKVRGLIRQSVQMNIGTFPINYHVDVELQLDRYDFDQKIYRFTDKTVVHNINSFLIYRHDDVGCGDGKTQFLPNMYRAVLDVPFSIAGMPLAEPDAQALLKRMDADKNTDHIVYAHFNLRIVYIDPLRKASGADAGSAVQYVQSGHSVSGHGMRLDARLDSVDFYEDEAATKLIYSYRP